MTILMWLFFLLFLVCVLIIGCWNSLDFFALHTIILIDNKVICIRHHRPYCHSGVMVGLIVAGFSALLPASRLPSPLATCATCLLS